MTSPHHGDIANLPAAHAIPADPAAMAAAVSAFLVGNLKAKPDDVILTEEPASRTVTFAFPGSLTGSVRITGPRTLSLSYIVANMWEYREKSEFESLPDLLNFLSRLTRLVRRFTHAAFGT